MRKTWILCLVMVLLFSMSGCGKSNDKNDTASSKTELTKEQQLAQEFLEKNFPNSGGVQIMNFQEVIDEQEIVIITTNFGVIRIQLFPEIAPVAVENFKQLIQNGYYNHTESNQVTFHRVLKDAFVQAGDPTGTGAGGASASGEPFADEFSEHALHFRGALSMANNGPDSNTSQFFIVQAPKSTITEDVWEKIEKNYQKAYPNTVKSYYQEYGGAPWLDFDHTVFGQVYEGMDVVDKIAAVETDEREVPLEPVIIESVEISVFSGAGTDTDDTDTGTGADTETGSPEDVPQP